MVNDIYFATTDGGLVTNRDLAKMALVVEGKHVDYSDLNAIREYANSCVGIRKEIIPSVKMCLKNGEKVKAIMIYRDRHPGMGLREAKEVIDSMEEKMRLGILK